MKILFNTNVIFSVFFLSLSSLLASNSLVEFKDISIEEAISQNKKIFVSFSAEWCLPCKVMDQSIFNDPEIADLLNQNFISIKADVDSYSGNSWNELYNANYLPTTLFASKNGQELNRFNGVPNRVDFINLLKEVLASKDVVTKKSNSKFVVPPSGLDSRYVVQVGAFSKESNAQKLIKNLIEASIHNYVIIKESQDSGRVIFKVVLTNYKSKVEAVKSLSLIKKKGFDGFVRRDKSNTQGNF